MGAMIERPTAQQVDRPSGALWGRLTKGAEHSHIPPEVLNERDSRRYAVEKLDNGHGRREAGVRVREILKMWKKWVTSVQSQACNAASSAYARDACMLRRDSQITHSPSVSILGHSGGVI